MKKEEWRVTDYDNKKGSDILEYYEDGILRFTFDGYRNDKSGCWRVYPRAPGMYSKMPDVKHVYYHEAKRA